MNLVVLNLHNVQVATQEELVEGSQVMNNLLSSMLREANFEKNLK